MGHRIRRGTVVLLAMMLATAALVAAPASAATPINFTATELLGKPTDTSIAVNVVPDETITLYYQYGTTSGVYTGSTSHETATGGQAHETVITGLQPDTRYYYRMQYQKSGEGDWTVRDEYTFHTARGTGDEFEFTIISDSHLGHLGTTTNYRNATESIAVDQPDFSLDLGDAFVVDGAGSQVTVNSKYLAQRDYFDDYANSTPVFLAMGNHEQEEGWNFDDTPFSQALGSIEARKAYYPTPVPDATNDFYTANEDTLAAISGDHYREDYYAFEWGDALFVVLDPFQYTMQNPYGNVAGEGSDDPATGDQWNWTLGYQQYNWFRNTLQNSDARFKFVFSHQVTGGQLSVSGAGGPGYVRGGAAAAPYFEWGGRNASGVDVFDTMRPGWGDPIHQLMVDNGVTAYFHGHDHQYAYEIVDGIVYQELAAPSIAGNGFNLYSESYPGTEKVLPGPGYLRVTVSPQDDEATVEYVKSDTAAHTVAYTYTMDANDVGGGNTNPVAVNDSAVVAENGSITIDVLDNDHDSDGDTLAVSSVTNPPHGSAVNNGGDDVTYTPDTDYCGADSFTYTITDGNGGSDSATVNVTVNCASPGAVLYRINANGSTLDATSGPDYVGVTANGTSGGVTVSGTSTNSTDSTINLDLVSLPLSAGDAQSLFQTTFYTTASAGSGMSFDFDVPDGSYDVKLHLIEQQLEGVGQRVYDVAFEGDVLLDDVDVYALTGSILKAYTATVSEVEVDDGVLNIDFINQQDLSYANVRGIEVIVAETEDTTAPVISLIGADPLIHEAGTTFTDPGATVTDNWDPTTTITGVSTVNPNVPGDYTITYDHTDNAGNPATTVVRDVQVVDSTLPVITLVGNNPMFVLAGSSFSDPGATVTDNVDATTSISGVGSVDVNVPGDYTLTYDYTDAAGNDAVTVTRTVTVTTDLPPVITLLGANPLVISADGVYVEAGATATDNEDGDLTASIIIDASGVDTATPGDYQVSYTVEDSFGNITVVYRDVSVVDTTAPVITLAGANPLTHEAGDAFVDPGATVTDNVDATVTISGVSTVNPNVPGDYTITYDHSDAAGNPAATVVRDVSVVDTTAPVITLLGANPMVLEVGDPFMDPGATVTDNVDATTTITGASTVNPSLEGDYTITYLYTDAAGNPAAAVVRNVSVVDTTSPVEVNTFIDDDDSIFEADIEWLAASGITYGCNPPLNDMFCPLASTTRGQMAAFFHRALGSVLVVDLGDAITFTDTTGSVFVDDIAWLSAAGITAGCNPPSNDRYCPAGTVTRGQMAAFLRRAFGDLIPTPAPSGVVFVDTADSVFVADIQWLVDAGITTGCGPDTFCPTQNVTRGQMAAFFRRAYQAAGL